MRLPEIEIAWDQVVCWIAIFYTISIGAWMLWQVITPCS